MAELPRIVVLASDADPDTAALAALLAEKLEGRATVQVVADLSEFTRSAEPEPLELLELPLAYAELVRPLDYAEHDLIERAPAEGHAGYGPPRRGRKGKPLRW